jgi:hypothetical protein
MDSSSYARELASLRSSKQRDVRKTPSILLGLILCIWIPCTRGVVWSQEASSSAHTEALIKQLGTGNVKAEDAAKTSDVALAKVCRKLEIPLLGLGHWTKAGDSGHNFPLADR